MAGSSGSNTTPDIELSRDPSVRGQWDFGDASSGPGNVNGGSRGAFGAFGTAHVSGHSFDCGGTNCPATAPAVTSATVGSSIGYWQSEPCTVNGGAQTCIEEDFDTGALNNATTTTVSLLTSIPNGLMSCLCTDNSSRVQTGNVQPIGCNVAGQSLPFTTIQVTVGATGESASCRVKGY